MKKNGLFKNLGESALTLSASVLIVKIIGVIYKVPLTYILGTGGMGYFNAAYTVYGFFYTVASAGIPKAVTIYIKREESGEGKEAGGEICKISMRAFGIFGFLVTLLYILLAKPISVLIGNSAAFYSILAIGPSVFFVVLSGVARGYLTARAGIVDIAISQLIEALSKLGLGLLFAFAGYRLGISIPMISAFSILGITLGSIFSAVYLLICTKIAKTKEKAGQNTRLCKTLLDKKTVLREVFTLSLPITLSASLLSASSLVDLGIIMRILKAGGLDEAAASAEYGSFTTLAIPMLMLVSSIITPICVPLLPKLTECACLGRREDFRKALGTSSMKVSLLCAPATLCFMLYPFDILDVLFSSQDSVMGAELLALISPSVIFLPVLTVVNTGLEAIGRIRSTVISLTLGAAVKSVLAACLIAIPEVGIRGAAISTSLSYLFSLVYSLVALTREVGSIGVCRYALSAFTLSLVSYAPVYHFLYSRVPVGSSFFKLMICGGIGTALYVALTVITMFFKAKLVKPSSKCTKNAEYN